MLRNTVIGCSDEACHKESPDNNFWSQKNAKNTTTCTTKKKQKHLYSNIIGGGRFRKGYNIRGSQGSGGGGLTCKQSGN